MPLSPAERVRATSLSNPRPKPSSIAATSSGGCAPYVAKGLWRREIIYAKEMLDLYVREQLTKMLDWYVGMHNDFQKSHGKMGKYLEKFLEPELWELLLKTYSDADYEQTWQALFTMAELFRKLAIPVANHFGFDYPYGDDERVNAHLHHVYHLPRDAQEMLLIIFIPCWLFSTEGVLIMRLWSLHPAYLDTKALVACWREGLLTRKVLLGNTQGYRNHPQLQRFKLQPDPIASLDQYLSAILDEDLPG